MTRIELVTSSLPRKRSTTELHWLKKRAEDEVRTRDPQLGRLMLYRLSYFRNLIPKKSGESRIRTYEGVSQQIYSLPQLATLVSPQSVPTEHSIFRADRGIRTHDPLITNQLLWPTELYRRFSFGLQI